MFLGATILLAFSFSFFQKSIGIIILIWIIAWIAEGNIKEKKTRFLKNQILFWLLSSVFWIQLLGLFFSAEMDNGWFQIEKKLSLVIFPLLLSATSFTKQDFFKILSAFCYGAIIAGAFCLIRAFVLFTASGDPFDFFYKSFSYFMHPSYFGMYINTAVLFLLGKINNSIAEGALIKKKIATILLLCFSILLVILIYSKAAILTLGIILVCYFFKSLLFDNRRKSFAIISASLVIIFVSSIFFFPKPVDRISLAYQSLKQDNKKPNSEVTEGTMLRVMIWGEALSLVIEKPFLGHGTGNAKQLLTEKYKQKGISFAEKSQLNAHNQFLQTGIENGLIGILALFALLLIPAFFAIKTKNYVAMGIPALIGVNFLFESMLGLQSGIVYTGFFLSLIAFAFKNSLFFPQQNSLMQATLTQ